MAVGACLLLGFACRAESEPAGPAADAPVVFYDWAGDMPQSVLDAFTAESGIPVRYEVFDSQEEAVQNLRDGKPYDVVVLEHDHLPALVAEGRLAEIDFAQVPNYAGISANFRDLAVDPGNLHNVPYHFGTTGIIVRTDLAGAPVTRWADLLDERFRGKIAIRAQSRELVGLTLLSLGYPLNSEDPAHLAAAEAWLMKLRAASFVVDVEAAAAVPRLLGGDAILLVGWAEDYRMARAANPDVAYVLPEEGTDLWGDSYTVPANAPHKREAMALIDFLLRPAVSAQLVNEKFLATANEAALPLVHAELRADPVIFPARADLDRAACFAPLTPAREERYAALDRRLDLAGPR